MDEGRMGGKRMTDLDRSLHRLERELAPDQYVSAEGSRILDSFDWEKIRALFEERAKKVDWQAQGSAHIAGRNDIFFRRHPWTYAKAHTPERHIEFDVDKIIGYAKRLGVPAEDYVLKVLLHEETHVAAGEENGRTGLTEGTDWHWVGEALVEKEARDQFLRYHANDPEASVRARATLDAIALRERTGHSEAIIALDAIVQVLAAETKDVGTDRDMIWNSLRKAHYRNAQLSSDAYTGILTSVMSAETVPAIRSASSGLDLCRTLVSDSDFMSRLSSTDPALAGRLTDVSIRPLTDEEGNPVIEV